MEGLGRLFNVVPIIADTAIKFGDAAAITFIGTGADTWTITTGATSAAATDPGDILDHYYWCDAGTAGTVAWAKVALAAASNTTGAVGAGTIAICVHEAMIPDTHKYVKCTSSAGGLALAILHDLKVQRKPSNLPIPNA
jgi:hypothetical protein